MVVGIDPGLTGALAYMGTGDIPDGTKWVTRDFSKVTDLPILDKIVNGWDLHALLGNLHPDLVVIEAQQAMPRQGVASSFRTGQNYGIVLGVVQALGVPMKIVRAAEWTRTLRVGADKDVHRRRACELFPPLASSLARVRDDGRADALLIAHWGLLQQQKGNAA